MFEMSIIADIKINIMLVDDMVINRLILEDLILQAFNNSSKIPITHAANGEEALAILKDNYDYDYDLIFMDVNIFIKIPITRCQTFLQNGCIKSLSRKALPDFDLINWKCIFQDILVL